AGTPREAVGYSDVAYPTLEHAFAVAIKRGDRGVARLVDGADPEAALRVGLAIVESFAGLVVGRRRESLAPAGHRVDVEDAVAHRDQQGSIEARRHARGL